MLLRHLALKYARVLLDEEKEDDFLAQRLLLPVPLRVIDYANDGLPRGDSLRDFLVNYYSSYGCPREGLADLLEREFMEGHCLILFDGLDEVKNDQRSKVVKEINKFVQENIAAQNKFIVTSRPMDQCEFLAEHFTHYTIESMSTLEISHFLEKWCTLLEAHRKVTHSLPIYKSEMKREVEAIRAVIDWIHYKRKEYIMTPLLLQAIIITHHTIIQRPNRRNEIAGLLSHTLPSTDIEEDNISLTAFLSIVLDWQYANCSIFHILGNDENQMHSDWVYLNELPWDADDSDFRIKEEVKKAIQWQDRHGRVLDDAAYRMLSQKWACLKGLPWEMDSPDLQVKEDVKKIMSATHEQANLLMEQKRSIISCSH
jgi:hypothetical protein